MILSSRVVQVEMIVDVALTIKRWVTRNGGFSDSRFLWIHETHVVGLRVKWVRGSDFFLLTLLAKLLHVVILLV